MSNIKNNFLKYFSLFILLLLSAFFIFYKQSEIPKGLTHDENELARAAFSIENKPYTPFTPIADGHGTPYLYSLLLSLKIFGVNKFALRLPNRIFSVISILLFYAILKIVFDKNKKLVNWLPFILSLILLASRWYLHFSRVAFEDPFLLLLELASLYGILLWQQKDKNIFLIISGIFAGLAFNSYQPGRIFFLLPLIVLFLNKAYWKSYIIYLFIFVLCILPMSSYLLSHPQSDIRINEQLFLKNGSLSLNKKISYLFSNINNSILMFFWKGDMNGTHNYTGKPAINPIMGILLIIGIIYSFIKERGKNIYIFSSFLLISLFPTVLTYPWENPNMLRTYSCLPSIIYFIGQGLVVILNLFHDLEKRIRIKFGITLLIVLILSSSIYELRTYFIYQPLVFRQSFDQPDYLKIIRQNAQKQQK